MQAYSKTCVIFAWQQPGMLTIFIYSEPSYNCIQTLPYFRKEVNLFLTLEIQDPGTLTILEYSVPGHISNQTHIQNTAKDLGWSVLGK